MLIEREYISSRGHRAWFRPMPLFLRDKVEDKLNETHPEPQVPTYIAVALGGDEEIHEYDRETAEQEGGEAWETWQAYEADLRSWENELNKRLNKVIRIKCMRIEMPESDEWIEEHEFLGVEVPKEGLEKKLFFIETEWIGTRSDIAAIMSIPLALSLQKPEVQRLAEESFRSEIQERDAAESGEEGTAAEQLED